MSVDRSWDRITQWFAANGQPRRRKLNPGAAPAAIEALEQAINAKLPDDFRESLLRHDGGQDFWLMPTHGDLYSVAEIRSAWEEYRDWQATGEYANPLTGEWEVRHAQGPIKPIFWNPSRLFVSDNSGDHLTLDLDPPDDGRYGQVLYHSHEIGPKQVLAPSWSAYLELVADELESGRYAIDSDGCLGDRDEAD